MNYSIGILLFILILMGCDNSNVNQVSVYKNSLSIPTEGFQFEINQRDTIELPAKKGGVLLHIDDITKGQTKIQIIGGDKILLFKSIRQDESIAFDIHANSYSITCLSLINKAIGIDRATFLITLSSKTTPQAERLAQKEKIEALIDLVRTSDITFIRNGEAYEGKKAAEHLKKKYDHANGKIQTLDQFIEHIASKSSMSGEAYQVRKRNGEVMKAVDWYEEVMEQ
jgi:hypothetical protein